MRGGGRCGEGVVEEGAVDARWMYARRQRGEGRLMEELWTRCGVRSGASAMLKTNYHRRGLCGIRRSGNVDAEGRLEVCFAACVEKNFVHT